MIDDYYHTEFEEDYLDIVEFRIELIEYLKENINVPELETEQDEFELKINELIKKYKTQRN